MSNLADAVRHALTQQPRQLPSRYLYDELGSALFEAICRLPWYPLTRAEGRLLDRHGAEVFRHLAPISSIVELGSGSGEKLAALIDRGGDAVGSPDVHLVDLSPAALAHARRTLARRPGLRVITHEARYEAGLAHAAASFAAGDRTLVLFLGSNIGNFDRAESDALIRAIRGHLRPGDALLLGADLVKPERDLLLAYDDPLQVTAAFNRNLLVRVNRELGGTFDLDRFAHRAVWNADASRVEMHLVAQSRQAVRVEACGLAFEMDAGESIWTESSYKYQPDAIVRQLQRACFHTLEQWRDPDDPFALTLAEAV